jgi:DNA-binding MarR family transcriptional regulator
VREMQETTNARFLAWLLAYPASSAQDLASAFSLHPATVYRHLGRLLAAGWLERITGYGGDARFLLTSHGTALLAQVLHQDTDQLASTWQRGLNAPAKLLPRLRTIDHLHTFARHFFHYAPQALARQGHAVVRWHLMRNWHAHFQVTASRIILVHAQAVLVWTVTGSQQDASHLWATERKHPAEARWHSAFILLESGLCDAALITARLRAWLRSQTALQREGASPAFSFAPLLVLVQSERQAEVWRRAARQAVHAEGAEVLALVGAIARLCEQENPWRQWVWRDLLTGAQLRLAPLFASLPAGCLPEGVQAHLAALQDLLSACERTSEVPMLHHRQEGKWQARPPLMVPSPRQRQLLTQLARTPYLSAEEIAAVLPRLDGEPLAASSAERLLRELARQGLAQRDLVVQESQAVWRWYLTEIGLRQVAAMHEVSLRHLRRQAERMHWMMQRQAAHQAGVYGVIAAFHWAARATGEGITVVWWDCGRGAERSYHYHGVQRNLRPDAELALRREGEGVSRLRLWLEYDTGSMNRRDLSRKMASYRDYWHARAWAAEGLTALPRLLFIVPEHGQEERVREACFAVLSVAGVRLRVLVTTAAHLQASGPYGPIWRQVFPELAEGERSIRRALWEERSTGERKGLIGSLPLTTML